MCSDNPSLPKEANKAKCFVISCFVFSLFSMIGFAGGIPGVVGAICGIIACVASSILICCAPKSTEEGGCKFTVAGVMLLIAGVAQIVMGIVVIAQLIMVLNEVNESSYCKDRYSDCSFDSANTACSNGDGITSYCYGTCYGTDWDKHGLCYKKEKGDTETFCTGKDEYDNCKGLHDTGKAIVTGIAVILFGVAAFFLLIAGLLNTIGGAYCLKAKAAIQAKGITPAPGAVVQGQVINP